MVIIAIYYTRLPNETCINNEQIDFADILEYQNKEKL